MLRFLAALVLVVVVGVLAATSLAGCGTAGYATAAQETPYCVDAQGTVYPPSDCDGGNPMYWYWLGAWSHSYGYGQHINVTHVHVTRIDSTDRTARARYGMPATGRVTSSYRYTPSSTVKTKTSSTVKTPTGSTVKTRTSTTVKSGGFLSRLGGSGRSSFGRSSFGGRK